MSFFGSKNAVVLFVLLVATVSFGKKAHAQSLENACTHSSSSSTSSISGALDTSLEIYTPSSATGADLNGVGVFRFQNFGAITTDSTTEIVGLSSLGHSNASQSQWRIVTDDDSDFFFYPTINSNYFIGFNDIDENAVVTIRAFDFGFNSLNMSGWTTEFGNTPGGTLFSASAGSVTLSGNGAETSNPVVILRPTPGQEVGELNIVSSNDTGHFNVFFGFIDCLDYSDAPGYGDATHYSVVDLGLGSSFAQELSTNTNAAATADSGDDGIGPLPDVIAGSTTFSIPTTSISATGSGTLHAWVDFNDNGSFEAGEHASVPVSGGTPSSSLSWSGVTTSTLPGTTFARFRISTDPALTSATPTGYAQDGEVEDYQLSIVLSTIVATDDTPVAVDTAIGGSITNVVSNDMRNSIANPTISTDVSLSTGTTAQDGITALGLNVTPAAGGISLNTSSGEITVNPGTTNGTYVYTYEICEVINPTNCDTATVTIVVGSAPIVANDDALAAVDGATGGTTDSVLANDTLNGTAVDPADITLTPGSAPSPADGLISMNADGTITVAARTTSGNYTYPYTICETMNATNCDGATASVVVEAPQLVELIEEDLIEILRDDLSAILTQQSEQMSDYSAGALNRLRGRNERVCLAAVNAVLEREGIRFETGKAVIQPRSRRILDEVAKTLGTCAGSKFELAGYADSGASGEQNTLLSQQRVEVVLRALTQRGVETEGFVARGYGEQRPIERNADRHIEFLPLEGAELQEACDSTPNLAHSLDASVDDHRASLEAHLRNEMRTCATDSWSIIEGTISHLETDDGLAQSMINLSYRRERFTDQNSVRGYFVGLYGSKSDITKLSTGDLSGVGINGGVFGADRLQNGLFVDFHLGAAVGRHSFDLDFDRSIGTINATGDYDYFATFAGAALSGEVNIGRRTITPRFGFDYAYTSGASVDVLTRLDIFEETGVIKLDGLSGGRIFAEVRDEHLAYHNTLQFAYTPRLACYRSIGGIDDVCGIGLSFDLSSVGDEDDLLYSVELDGERGSGYSRLAFGGSISKRLRNGAMLTADTSVDKGGALSVRGGYEMQF